MTKSKNQDLKPYRTLGYPLLALMTILATTGVVLSVVNYAAG